MLTTLALTHTNFLIHGGVITNAVYVQCTCLIYRNTFRCFLHSHIDSNSLCAWFCIKLCSATYIPRHYHPAKGILKYNKFQFSSYDTAKCKMNIDFKSNINYCSSMKLLILYAACREQLCTKIFSQIDFWNMNTSMCVWQTFYAVVEVMGL